MKTMINFQAGKDLKLTVVTSTGKVAFYGQYIGSDENTFVLRLDARTPLERRVYFHRDKITTIEEVVPGMLAEAC
jgi:hypothetical protein